MYRLLLTLILFSIALGCVTAPEEVLIDCYGFTGNEQVASVNHCLQAPYTTATDNATIQAAPDGWQLINELVNADGVVDEYTARARITANGFGLSYELHNGVTGINGRWGYGQMVELDTGCYLLKVSGHGYINDPPHSYNFTLSGWFNAELISQQVLPAQDGFELIYPFMVTVGGEYPFRWSIDALWGTAGHGSRIDILGAGVLKVDSDYCSML